MTKASIRGERGEFSADATRSWTLPSRYYVDPELHDRELSGIFRRSWVCVGHACDLREAGSYLTETIAGQPLLAIRGRDGEVRAFFNVCQHRGHELLHGTGRLPGGITCPYHAWSYGHDGQLLAARLTEDVPGFDKRDFPLKPVRVALAAGLVFVNLDREADPFEQGYAGIDETILWHLDQMPAYDRVDRYIYDIAANWKVVVDNFSEGYHIPVAHPRLATLYNTAKGSAVHGPLFSAFRNAGHPTYKHMTLGPNEPYLGWTLWPNLCMLSLPGSKNLIVLRMDPAGPQRCRERVDIYAPAGEASANLDEIRRLFAEIFNREDIAIVESVQRGVASMAFDQSRYVADRKGSWFSEAGLHTFHARVIEAID
ncbi:MAG: aromatic ring-hydroxylating dioxygenase subunit alpha [Alphaproteobacteria bacterium]